MSTRQQTEALDDSSDQYGHVELTNESPPEHDDTMQSEALPCHEAAAVITPTKESQSNQSFTSKDDTLPDSPWSSFRDDVSTSSESSNASWGTAAVAEMRFTMISNLLFFTSATIQTVMALTDLRSARKKLGADDDGWDSSECDGADDGCLDDDYVYTAMDRTYYAFYSFAPLLCVMSALFDVQYYREHTASPMSWAFWCPCFFRSDDNSTVVIENLKQQGNLNHQGRYQPLADENSINDESSYSTSPPPAENPYVHLAAALIFGLAATLEFYSTFLYDYYEDDDSWDDDVYLVEEENKRPWYISNYRIDFIGMHLYLLCGVVTLYSQRSSFCSNLKCVFRDDDEKSEESSPDESSYRFAQLLTLVGTLFFITGTLLDCTIAWLSDPAIRFDAGIHMGNVTISCFGLTSCLLWNIDAIFYIWADVLVYSLHKEGSEGRKYLLKNCMNNNNDVDDMEDDKNDEGYPQGESMLMLPDLAQSPSLTSYSSIDSYSSINHDS